MSENGQLELFVDAGGSVAPEAIESREQARRSLAEEVLKHHIENLRPYELGSLSTEELDELAEQVLPLMPDVRPSA